MSLHIQSPEAHELAAELARLTGRSMTDVVVDALRKQLAEVRRHEQQRKNQAAIALLDEWLADTSGYDEAVWPILKQTIEENRLSERKRFGD